VSTYHLEMAAAIGGPALGVLLAMWAFNRLLKGWAGAPVEAPVYARHRADDGTGGGNVLAPSPVEVIRPRWVPGRYHEACRPDREECEPVEERTEEMPVLAVAEPVEHVEVSEDLGLDGYAAPEPSAELAEPTEAERRLADLHDEALWENEYRDSRRRHDKAVARFHTSATDHVIDEWLRGEERLPFLVEARCAASETAMEHTGEISMAALLAEAGTR
jgi:hypothetical protein